MKERMLMTYIHKCPITEDEEFCVSPIFANPETVEEDFNKLMEGLCNIDRDSEVSFGGYKFFVDSLENSIEVEFETLDEFFHSVIEK